MATGAIRGRNLARLTDFAVLMAASIMRSEFMSENSRAIACDSLIFDALHFNIYAFANLAAITVAGSQ